MTAIRFHEVVAGLVAVGLLAGIIGLVFLERDIPQLLSSTFGTAMGWIFGSATQRVNNHLNGGSNPHA